MWTVVYIAPNQEVAEKVREILSREGFLVTLRAVPDCGLVNVGSVEVLVPEGEVEEAHDILCSVLGR